MKVQVTLELDESWDSYKSICDELLLEDLDLCRKDGVSVIDVKRL